MRSMYFFFIFIFLTLHCEEYVFISYWHSNIYIIKDIFCDVKYITDQRYALIEMGPFLFV